ncbi:MAG: hypothetical protein V4772_06180 [Pseudomonadota bacterium]
MTELKIALWGAPGMGQAELADQLTPALRQLPMLAKGTLDASLSIEVLEASTAPKNHSVFDLNFLMGLELAASETLTKKSQSADFQIRASLASTGTAYEVLYGTAPDRLAQALEAIRNLIKNRFGVSAELQAARAQRPWVWACEKCSDPVCEHRLLTDLLASRPAAGSE